MMERREFVRICAVLLGSSVIPVGCGSSGGDGEEEVVGVTEEDLYFTPKDLSRKRWVDIPSTTVSVTHKKYGVIDMEITALDNELFDPSTDQFSIVITGPANPKLREGKYEVYNESLGYFELYLQPGESPAGVQNYRTFFSILET